MVGDSETTRRDFLTKAFLALGGLSASQLLKGDEFFTGKLNLREESKEQICRRVETILRERNTLVETNTGAHANFGLSYPDLTYLFSLFHDKDKGEKYIHLSLSESSITPENKNKVVLFDYPMNGNITGVLITADIDGESISRTYTDNDQTKEDKLDWLLHGKLYQVLYTFAMYDLVKWDHEEKLRDRLKKLR